MAFLRTHMPAFAIRSRKLFELRCCLPLHFLACMQFAGTQAPGMRCKHCLDLSIYSRLPPRHPAPRCAALPGGRLHKCLIVLHERHEEFYVMGRVGIAQERCVMPSGPNPPQVKGVSEEEGGMSWCRVHCFMPAMPISRHNIQKPTKHIAVNLTQTIVHFASIELVQP